MRFSPKGAVALGLVLAAAGGLVYGFATQADQPEVAPAPVEAGARGEQPAEAGPDEAEVHKALDAFVAAFNDNDAAKLAATLTDAAEFVDDDANRVAGARPVGDLFRRFFEENPGVQLRVRPDGARTVAPGVAVEDGESVIANAGNEARTVRRFTVVYAKTGGAWKIASIRDYPEASEEPAAAEEPLKGLEFLVGGWVDESGDSLLATTIKLSPDRSCLVREFTVLREGKELLTGVERVAWDPDTGALRGVSLDSAGGHCESTWTKDGDSWFVRDTGVMGDGNETACTYVIKPLGQDRIQVKTMHKVVGGTAELCPTATLVRRVIVREPRPDRK
jgi:uncharacterized protein (TIGR02246 family)